MYSHNIEDMDNIFLECGQIIYIWDMKTVFVMIVNNNNNVNLFNVT